MMVYVVHMPSVVLGYIDPGTGSLVLQVVIGGILGALFVMKNYWRRIIRFIVKRGRNRIASAKDETE